MQDEEYDSSQETATAARTATDKPRPRRASSVVGSGANRSLAVLSVGAFAAIVVRAMRAAPDRTVRANA